MTQQTLDNIITEVRENMLVGDLKELITDGNGFIYRGEHWCELGFGCFMTRDKEKFLYHDNIKFGITVEVPDDLEAERLSPKTLRQEEKIHKMEETEESQEESKVICEALLFSKMEDYFAEELLTAKHNTIYNLEKGYYKETQRQAERCSMMDFCGYICRSLLRKDMTLADVKKYAKILSDEEDPDYKAYMKVIKVYDLMFQELSPVSRIRR